MRAIPRSISSAVAAAPGVVRVLTASDIPGVNDVSPDKDDDPMFADGLVEYYGQSIFAVAAETIEQARAAAAEARSSDYEDLPAILTIEQAMAAQSYLEPPYVMQRGDAAAAIAAAPHKLEGRIEIGGQEHFYLEGQAALAIPGEDGDMMVHSSTQHPSEIQHKVAAVLGLANHAVTVEVRRMGGGFGGKESQGNLPACVAALAAHLTGRPAKCVYDRDDDFMLTGKRHDFRIDYRVGFDETGASSASTSSRPCAAACPSTSRSRSPTARCSTPTTATSSRRPHHLASPARRTRSRTPPSAASAARKAWSAWSASSTTSPRDLGLDPLVVRAAQFLCAA